MNTPTFANKAYQALFMNFIVFSEGVEDYNHNRAERSLGNLKELLFYLSKAQVEDDFQLFRQTCAKLRPHLRNLHNYALNRLLDDIAENHEDRMSDELIQKFYFVSERIIRELLYEQ
jgi:hypothetical protein